MAHNIEKQPSEKDVEESSCCSSKVNNANNSSSDSETELINLSLRRKSRHRQFTQSFSFNPLPLRIIGHGEVESICAASSSVREVTLGAPQLIDDSSDIDVDTDYHISNDSSDSTTNRSIVYLGRSLTKSDIAVKRTIRKRKTRKKFICYKTK